MIRAATRPLVVLCIGPYNDEVRASLLQINAGVEFLGCAAGEDGEGPGGDGEGLTQPTARGG